MSTWPADLAPATPSALYGIVNIDPASRIFVMTVDSLVYYTVAGAASYARIDFPERLGLQRDIVDAAFVGRGPMVITGIADTSGSYTPTQYGPLYTQGGDSLLVAANSDPLTATVLSDQVATLQKLSDNVTHTPPHQVVIAATYIRFFDQAGATGNMLLEIPADIYGGLSQTIPQYPGMVPPAFVQPIP